MQTQTHTTAPTHTQLIIRFNDLADWLRDHGVTITRTPRDPRDLWPGTFGWYHHRTKTIYLQPGLSTPMALTVLTHEAAHAAHYMIDGDMANFTPTVFDETVAHGVTIALAHRLGTIHIPEVRESIERGRDTIDDITPRPPAHTAAHARRLINDIVPMLARPLGVDTARPLADAPDLAEAA